MDMNTTFRHLAQNEMLTALSRIFQLVAIPLGLTAIFWFATTINGLQLTVTKLSTQMEYLDGDRYSGTDAKHDFAVVNVQIEDLTRRVGILESDGQVRPRR